MKKIIILFSIFIINANLFAQDKGFWGWNYSEIFIITRGLPTTQTIRYKMESQIIVWTKPDTDIPSTFSITDTLNNSYYPPLSQSETSNTLENTSIYLVGGFNFIGGNNQVDPYTMDSYGYGLYKVSSNYGTSYFYIDYRDNRYRHYTYATGHQQDIYIRYNALLNQFALKNSSPNMQNLDSTDWTNISNRDYLSIWELKNQNLYDSPITSEFPYFWKNSLVMLKYEEENPRLVWGRIPDFVAAGYKIYHAVSNVTNSINCV